MGVKYKSYLFWSYFYSLKIFTEYFRIDVKRVLQFTYFKKMSHLILFLYNIIINIHLSIYYTLYNFLRSYPLLGNPEDISNKQ